MRTVLLCSMILAAALSAAAQAQSPGTPGVITGGADGVIFNGKPAAVLSGKTGCGGVVVGGAGGIYINGKPAARTGDQTSGCPVK